MKVYKNVPNPETSMTIQKKNITERKREFKSEQSAYCFQIAITYYYTFYILLTNPSIIYATDNLV